MENDSAEIEQFIDKSQSNEEDELKVDELSTNESATNEAATNELETSELSQVINDNQSSKDCKYTTPNSYEMKPQFIRSVFTLSSMSLGVGVFVLPSLLNTTGVVFGVFMLIAFAVMSAYTQFLVIKCCQHPSLQKYNISSFEELSNHTLFKAGEFLLALFILLTALTANCSHIQTIGQILNELIEWFYDAPHEENLSNIKTFILYLAMMLLTIPWLFQRHLHGLSAIGPMSVSCICITALSLIIICLAKMANGEHAQGDDATVIGFDHLDDASFWKTDFWRTAPAFCFVYSSIFELFPVYKELLHCNVKLIKKSILYSTIICCTVYVFVAVVVVITFGDNIEDNALDNISSDNYWMQFCKFCLVIVIILLYPLINYLMCNSGEKLLELFFSDKCGFVRQMDERGRNTMSIFSHIDVYPMMDLKVDNYRFDVLLKREMVRVYGEYYGFIVYHRRDIISVFFVFVVICIDIFVSDLPSLFGLCGSVGQAFVCYILPCVIYIKVYWKEMSWRSLVINSLIILFASAMMIYSTTVILMHVNFQ